MSFVAVHQFGRRDVRFLIQSETLLGTMRQRRDTVAGVLEVVADYHSRRFTNIHMTDEQTGRVYRWAELSKPTFRLSDEVVPGGTSQH